MVLPGRGELQMESIHRVFYYIACNYAQFFWCRLPSCKTISHDLNPQLPFMRRETTTTLLLQGYSNRARNHGKMRAVAAIASGFRDSSPTRVPPFEGQTIIVTGSNRGLGSGIAAHLAAGGARLVLPCRRLPVNLTAAREKISDMASSILRKYGNTSSHGSSRDGIDIIFVEMDLASLKSIERAVAKINSVLGPDGRANILVNNAGLAPIRDEVRFKNLEHVAICSR